MNKEKLLLQLLILVGLFALVQFTWWFLLPGHVGNELLYWLFTFSLFFKVSRTLLEWYHYFGINVPECSIINKSNCSYSVDIFTTACPGEPHDMIIKTLEAIQAITYPHTSFLCDEGGDPVLMEVCNRLNIKYVNRTEKVDAKAGNINNALKIANGEICLILDPDHIPSPQILDRLLPHFDNKEIGYVQIVQAYYNQGESLVACGAAQQTYMFYGPIMMSMGEYGTAQAIGANCSFRRAALDSIGGHAAGLCEDMHTAMLLHSKGWKSIYLPEILTRGLVPATLNAFYKQQFKWARGSFELLMHVYPKVLKHLSWRQKLHYFMTPLYYLFGIIGLIDLLIPVFSLISGEYPWRINLLEYAFHLLPVISISLLIRMYAQRWLMEEHEKGFSILGGLLRVGAWWVYTLALFYALLRINVPYLPTPKSDKPLNRFWICLPNIISIGISLFSILYAFYYYGVSKSIWILALRNHELPSFYSYALLMAGLALVNSFLLGFNVILAQEGFIASMHFPFKRMFYSDKISK